MDFCLNYFLSDPQQLPPDAYCDRCGAELWGAEAAPDLFGHVLCDGCRHELLKIRNRVQASA